MSMKPSDRRDPSYKNTIKYPRSTQKETVTYEELRQQKMNLLADLKEAKDAAQKEKNEFQEKLQLSDSLVSETKLKAEENYRLYIQEQEQYQNTFELYSQEKAYSSELLIKYQEANALQLQYLEQCNELQIELKNERRSKASIKGWETRRKAENERLKLQIGDMVVLLRESLERKEESINYLYLVGDRMDRIQRLMDSVEQESTRDPVGLLEKLMRVWLAVQKILAE
jgi:hypothetical protein